MNGLESAVIVIGIPQIHLHLWDLSQRSFLGDIASSGAMRVSGMSGTSRAQVGRS
jgi:hypothetical protein